jgi:hypothetical protein
MSESLRNEIYRHAHYVEGQGDGIYMVLIRMDAIEDAVRAWEKARRRRARLRWRKGARMSLPKNVR